MSGGAPTFGLVEILAVRGDRLVLGRGTVRYDEIATEMLSLCQWDTTVSKAERLVQFDLDDLDAALYELDRLHAEIEAGNL